MKIYEKHIFSPGSIVLHGGRVIIDIRGQVLIKAAFAHAPTTGQPPTASIIRHIWNWSHIWNEMHAGLPAPT